METSMNKLALGLGISFLFLVFSAKTQLNLGLSGGVSTGAVEIQHIDRGFTDIMKGENIMGYEMGLFVKYKAGPLYVKPMANYAYQSGTVSYQGEDFSYKATKIGVPIMFGLNLVGPFSIEAGPVYNYLVDVTHQYGTYDWQAGKNGLGYRAGIAFDFGPLILNASYEGMQYTKGDSNKTGFNEPHKLIFGAGIKLGGGK